MTLLQVENLKKVYADGTAALGGIDFKVEAGEFIAVIGPSGAGKSTLLRCLNQMVGPTSGKVIFQGADTINAGNRKLRQIRREMGMIFQGFNLVERVSVLTNVLHGRLGYMSWRGALGLYSKSDIQEATRLLERVGLGEQIHKRADELSGGQQQRVGIARALAQKPKLILADEPIASLDPAASEVVMNSLYTFCKEDGIACLCNLHQVDMAKKYATRIIGIYKGTKVFDGTPEQLTDEMIELIYNQNKGGGADGLSAGEGVNDSSRGLPVQKETVLA
ncbi:phosphonate ABC transporter ATP-binding protein [Paenibacillus alkaliterrae]|uniref:phosphonate ABC transporter ATP-binding protein n=1 Tax=Paenibacillus alkaliterrae TaxID=320909 RepID=UPI001F237D69|nr:phosphonate ABC transporter ATP-binding protein [Paenibacillus alkaliterrae]MCF2941428.1 phosphonate ABC transporter ATP-binding protein [Paenibacillus alkaliterrae]